MHSTRILLLAGCVLAVGLAGCKTTELGTAVGSTVGGIVGSQFGSGVGNALATSGGIAIGGLLGAGIAEYLDEQSQQQAEQSASTAIVTGQNQSWSNPNAGTSGTVVVTGQTAQTTTSSVPVLKDRVQETPPLTLVGGSFTVSQDANVRGGPGTDYKTVGSLAKGETVEVVGQVQGKDWYMISQGGVATGFVSTSLLKPVPIAAPAPAATAGTTTTGTTTTGTGGTTGATATSAPPPPPAPPSIKPEGAITQREIATSGVCRTINQSVTLKDGTTKTDDNVTACQTTEGWQVASAGRQSRP